MWTLKQSTSLIQISLILLAFVHVFSLREFYTSFLMSESHHMTE